MIALLAFLLTAIAPPVRNADGVRRALETRYKHARTLKAVFFERYTDGSGGVTAESGTVYFSRPGRMRWEYESPEQKLFLVDGTNVWFYVPTDHTASRAKLKESSDWRTPLALLAGKADLSTLCSSIEIVSPASSGQGSEPAVQGLAAVQQVLPVSPGDTVLRCIPRGRPDTAGGASQDVLLETDADANLVGVVIHEPGNITTEFRFGNWQENIPLPEAKFHFRAPTGVAVVDEESLAGEIR
ncbi:MAG: LolA family protein [Candidatus Acidiferrales bacterium]